MRNADVFLGIIAQRYGHVPDKQEKSVTEQEYDEAVKRNIPRLIYLLDPTYDWPNDRVELDDKAQKKLDAFKERIKKENALSWFTTQDDLSKKVVAGLTKELRRQEEITHSRQRRILLFTSLAIILIFSISTSIYFLMIINQGSNMPTLGPTDCSSAHPSILEINSFGIVLDQPSSAKYLTVRDTPNIHGKQVAELEPFQTFHVLAGPECFDGDIWFRVDYGGISSGWIIEQHSIDATYTYLVQPIPLSTQYPNSTPCISPFFFGSDTGCPKGLPVSVSAAYQAYEHGFMIWRSQPDEFYAFVDDGSLFIIIKSIIESMPNNPVNDIVPTGLYKPISGFGRVWGNFDKIHDSLGWAISPELGYSLVVQNVELLSSPSNDKIIDYLQLPDKRVVAVGIGKSRFWRFAKQS